jgi:hypothetical protein
MHVQALASWLGFSPRSCFSVGEFFSGHGVRLLNITPVYETGVIFNKRTPFYH